ncbi:MAG: ATP-binding cassette domain-containing protein [Christensenellaceae bacterium]|nr:ATP-binding cassette domain-containing protein [Christensenellaceae bacterium]
MKLELKNINKSFGENHVLKGISLEATSGKALGVLGRNGAGKTTAIRIVMGVFPQDEGEIFIDGKPIDRKHINFGYLPEERGLYPKKIILDQLVYFAMLKGMNKTDAVKSVKHWLDRLNMSEYSNKKLETLSKGNQQKIQLIVTLVSDPDIIILDEPFSGLDPVNAKLLEDIVKEELAKNKLVFFSSHQMNYIEEFCENIAILNKGNIVLNGNIHEIKRNYDRSKLIIAAQNLENIKNNIDEESFIEKDNLIVQLKSEADKNKFLNQIVSKNLDVDEIKVFEPSLKDIFVEYTEESI